MEYCCLTLAFIICYLPFSFGAKAQLALCNIKGCRPFNCEQGGGKYKCRPVDCKQEGCTL